MELLMDFVQVAVGYMGINLGGIYIGMAEESLYATDISAIAE